MARVRVKICGVMRPEDAAAACRHGADAIGMVFHTAQARYVTIDRARAIIAAVEGLEDMADVSTLASLLA